MNGSAEHLVWSHLANTGGFQNNPLPKAGRGSPNEISLQKYGHICGLTRMPLRPRISVTRRLRWRRSPSDVHES